MNVVVFGASGASGRLVVASALAAGHAVTAFVREAGRLPLRHDALRVVEGDAMDPASVASAIQPGDAVICTLGNMPDTKADRARRQPGVPVCSVGTRHILAALPAQGARLIVESSVSVGSSYGTGRLGAGFIVRLALRQVMADKEKQEAAVRASRCDWTLLRPVRLTQQPARGALRTGTDLRWSISATATRADLARFMVQILADRTTYGQAITLMN